MSIKELVLFMNPAETMRRIAQSPERFETGDNRGKIVDYSGVPTSGSRAYCAGLVTKVMEDCGYGAVFKECKNRFFVPELINHAEHLKLIQTTDKKRPEIGSLVTIGTDSQGRPAHTGMVIASNAGGIDVAEGNVKDVNGKEGVAIKHYSDKDIARGVVNKEYISGEKITKYVIGHQAVAALQFISGKKELKAENVKEADHFSLPPPPALQKEKSAPEYKR